MRQIKIMIKQKLIKNNLLRNFIEELEGSDELPKCIIEFMRNKILDYIDVKFIIETQDYIEFNLFNTEYVVYVNYKSEVKMCEKKRYLYLKSRQKI